MLCTVPLEFESANTWAVPNAKLSTTITEITANNFFMIFRPPISGVGLFNRLRFICYGQGKANFVPFHITDHDFDQIRTFIQVDREFKVRLGWIGNYRTVDSDYSFFASPSLDNIRFNINCRIRLRKDTGG